MLEALKRWIQRRTAGADWQAPLAAWADSLSYSFKRVRDVDGFVIDGNFDGQPWRLECGPPQRQYILGRELRLRMELELPPGLQMMVLTRPLMESLERDAFERFTESMQTTIDSSTPEEMRWLVMFPKADLNGMKALRSHFGALASVPLAAETWLAGALALRLEQAAARFLSPDEPFLLMTQHGRLYLRLEVTEPDAELVQRVVDLFRVAAEQAPRVAQGLGEGSSDWPTTSSTAWQSHLEPEPRRPPQG